MKQSGQAGGAIGEAEWLDVGGICFCWKSEADARKKEKGGRRYDVAKVGHLNTTLVC